MADDFLKSLGPIARSAQQLRFGPGVVGKTAYVVIALNVVFAIIANQLKEPLLLVGLALTDAAVVVLYVLAILRFAAAHPDVAVLEGGSFVHYHQIELAAKGMGSIPPGPLVVDPANPPSLPPPGEEAQE